MTILLAGATGLIGRDVARLLSGPDLNLLLRRPIDRAGDAKQLVADPVGWPDLIFKAKPAVAISTLGTTMRRAGSKEAFCAVDHHLVLSVALAAKEAGVRHFITVSSVGATAKTSNFYLRTKGEVEEAIKAIGFARVDILRPGLLRGERGGDRRPGERIAIAISPVTDFLTPAVLDQYRSIPGLTVAKAIAALARADGSGIHIQHNREMIGLAAGR